MVVCDIGCHALPSTTIPRSLLQVWEWPRRYWQTLKNFEPSNMSLCSVWLLRSWTWAAGVLCHLPLVQHLQSHYTLWYAGLTQVYSVGCLNTQHPPPIGTRTLRNQSARNTTLLNAGYCKKILKCLQQTLDTDPPKLRVAHPNRTLKSIGANLCSSICNPCSCVARMR